MLYADFLTKEDLLSDEILDLIQEKFEIQKDIIQQELTSILGILDATTPLTFYLEYPYIDKFYRDSYYSFFAKKHHNYNRNSFRISIFKEDLKAKSIHDIENLDAIYLGYFTLRPTPLRIIGSTVLSPKALKTKTI